MHRSPIRLLLAASLVAALLLALAGCGGTSASTSTDPVIPQGMQESSSTQQPTGVTGGGSSTSAPTGTELGQLIFTTGNAADGQPVAIAAGSGGPCARCHGTDAKGQIGPDIRWKVLTGAEQSAGRGPRFTLKDEAAFGQAITTGNAGGGQLRGMMPQYKLSDAEISAIAAYLKTL